MTTSTATAAGCLCAALVLAACGGHGHGGRTTTVVSSDRQVVAFTSCMRAHGIRLSDPLHRPGQAGLSLSLPSKTPVTLAAYGACSHLLGPISAATNTPARALSAATRLGLIRYAQCMRSHGVPMLDPTAEGNLNLGHVPGIGAGIGRYTPQFRSADHRCRRALPVAVPDNGTGP
jgi:hypothetical protein